MKPPAIMYQFDVNSFYEINYYDIPLKGLTYVDGYLYLYEYDWDLHRYILVRLEWLESKMYLFQRWTFIVLVKNTLHKPKFVRRAGQFLWYKVVKHLIPLT